MWCQLKNFNESFQQIEQSWSHTVGKWLKTGLRVQKKSLINNIYIDDDDDDDDDD